MNKAASTMGNANGEFAIVFNNFLLQTNKIIAFRNDVLFLVENGKAQLVQRANEKIRTIKELSNSEKAVIQVTPAVEKIVSDALDAFNLVKNPDNAIRQSRRRIDAASVVFIHSLLDATLYSLCDISFALNPDDWLPFVKERKIKVGDLLADGKTEAVQAVTKDFLVSLERESLIKKSDVLHVICKPPAHANFASNFTFSKDALETFDKLRHDIVHGLQFGSEIFTIKRELNFGLKAGVYFSSMVRYKYGLEKEISEQQYEQLVAEN
jgi:hypothetical protein